MIDFARVTEFGALIEKYNYAVSDIVKARAISGVNLYFHGFRGSDLAADERDMVRETLVAMRFGKCRAILDELAAGGISVTAERKRLDELTVNRGVDSLHNF